MNYDYLQFKLWLICVFFKLIMGSLGDEALSPMAFE